MRTVLTALGMIAFVLAAPALAQADAHADAAKAYRIETSQAPLKVKRGEQGQAKVTVVPRSDAHVSPDAPVTVTISGGPALELPKQKLGRAEAHPTAAKGVEFDIPFTAAANDKVEGTLSFFICTESLCEKQKREIALAVEVE